MIVGAEPADVEVFVASAIVVLALEVFVRRFGGDAGVAPGDEGFSTRTEVSAWLEWAAEGAALDDEAWRFGVGIFLDAV